MVRKGLKAGEKVVSNGSFEIGYFTGLPDARSAQIRRAWAYYAGLVAAP